MNKSKGDFVPDKWRLTFQGGPLDGKTISHPTLPERFGKRPGHIDPATSHRVIDGGQFWYIPRDIDEFACTATMVLG